MARGWFVLVLLSGVAMPQDVTRELAGLYDTYLEERAALDPEWATGVGLHQHDGRLTRWDDASFQARAKFVDTWLARVSDDTLDARLWRNDLLSQQYEYRRRDVRTLSPGLPFGTVSALHDMLVKDYAPKAERLANINKRLALIPLMIDHVLMLGVDELEKIGRREFEKTIRMLEEIEKDWPAVLEKMKHDHPKPDGLLEYYRKEVARARQFMIDRKLVGIPEWEKLEVVDTPAFQQSSIPYAAYSRPGPLDSAKTGHFYVTPVAKNAKPEEAEAQLAAHNIYDVPGTVWHEAYPGHHLQFVYAKDMKSKIRKLNDSPLLSEGWGLYCEELANETGYYTDKRERLMQLNWRLQRAARILLDVRLHTGAITYDDAVKFLVDEVKLNKPQAESSVNAYSQSPTYFPTYLLGMLEIHRIREKCRARLADRFTLKEFHERFLAFGNVPPALIEAELDRDWK